MKNILLLLFISFSFLNLNAQSNSPNFKEIYNFEVGDIFFYKIQHTDCGGIPCMYKYSYEKHEIVQKTINGDTTTYIRLINDSNKDTVNYIDSANNILNKKNHEIGVIKSPYYPDSMAVRVKIGENDTILQKIVGGRFNCYIYKNGIYDTTNFIKEVYIEQSFEKGLGLVGEDYGEFEIGIKTDLIGYRKGNDTTGILTGTIDKQNKVDKIKIYPNPCRDKLFVIGTNKFELYTIDFYNPDGIFIKRMKNAKDEIPISDLNPGVYILKISSHQEHFFQKIIKQ